MPDSATAKKLASSGASFALRYGLAFASVAGALLLELLFHHFNLAHPFAAFALSAIAITFWYGGTKPGIVAVLLSSLIRGFIFEGETSSLSRVLYELVFLTFAILMIWVRRRKEALEVAIVDQTAELTTANENLRRRKEQLDGLFELSPDAVILTDDDFHVLRVNKEFTRIFGYTAEEVAGKWLPELIVSEELRAEGIKNRERLLSGNRVELETIRQRKDGVPFDVSVVARGISLGPDLVAFYLIYRDITERKKAERELTRNENYLAEGQRVSRTGSFGWCVSSGKIYWSQETFRVFEVDLATEPTIKLILERTHPEDRQLVQQTIETAAQQRSDVDLEHRLLMADGTVKHVRVVGHPSNRNEADVEYVGAVMDISEAKRTEESLRRNENYLAAAQKLAHMGSWAYEVPSGELLYVSDEWYRIYGFNPKSAKLTWEERLGRVHPDDRKRCQTIVDRAIREKTGYEIEFRIVLPDDNVKYVHTIARPIITSLGGLVQFVGSTADITDRKQAEQTLRKSEERWRSIFENSAIGVALTDLNGRFLATNHVYQTIVGYTEQELLALCFLDVTHEDYREANWALISELLEGKRQQFQIEKKYLRKDGSSIWVSNNVSLVPGAERAPRFIMALSEDITQRKRAEEALQRSEGYLAEAQKLTHTGSWRCRSLRWKMSFGQKRCTGCSNYSVRRWMSLSSTKRERLCSLRLSK
jgi:PAS domain S-box-containing protein